MDVPFVMVAEDEAIIGYDLCQTVAEAGCEVEGPLPDVSSAMLSFQKRKPDLAILDVQLGRDNVFPLAEQLMMEDVKIIFHSGNYSAADVAVRFPGAIVVEKPCPPSEMLQTVQATLASA